MNINDIWKEIKNMYGSVNLGITSDTESYIYKGIKFKKKLDNITIYNTKKRGDYYQEINPQQYDVFFEHGIKYGCYQVMTDNYEESLDRISIKIQEEINIRNNMKHFMALKEMRVTLLKKYTDANKIKLKLLT